MPLMDSSHAKKKKFISVIMQRWQSLKKIVVAPEIKKVYMIPDVLMRWDEMSRVTWRLKLTVITWLIQLENHIRKQENDTLFHDNN